MSKIFEKVNPSHPDTVADRIAGALVDLVYEDQDNPKIAVEVLIGHGECNIIVESSVLFAISEVEKIVERIAGENIKLNLKQVPQDVELAKNQEKEVRCGDNGIFKGSPVSEEQQRLTNIIKKLYETNPTDGKYIINDWTHTITACQSNINQINLTNELKDLAPEYKFIVNPLGYWTGGINVDTGATNRKLGSDMGEGVTGGGLVGKDLSKADVSVNIYCFLQAQKLGKVIDATCNIGDKYVDVDGEMVKYSKIVEVAKKFIFSVGGFEKFAEWGLIR